MFKKWLASLLVTIMVVQPLGVAANDYNVDLEEMVLEENSKEKADVSATSFSQSDFVNNVEAQVIEHTLDITEQVKAGNIEIKEYEAVDFEKTELGQPIVPIVSDYFTVYGHAKSFTKVKNDDSGYGAFSDGYNGDVYLNLNGPIGWPATQADVDAGIATETTIYQGPTKAIKFTTSSSNAQVKIWWHGNGTETKLSGDDNITGNRENAIYDESHKLVVKTKDNISTNGRGSYISTLMIEDAGTYYLGGVVGGAGSNYIYKVTVTESVEATPTPTQTVGAATLTGTQIDEAAFGKLSYGTLFNGDKMFEKAGYVAVKAGQGMFAEPLTKGHTAIFSNGQTYAYNNSFKCGGANNATLVLAEKTSQSRLHSIVEFEKDCKIALVYRGIASDKFAYAFRSAALIADLDEYSFNYSDACYTFEPGDQTQSDIIAIDGKAGEVYYVIGSGTNLELADVIELPADYASNVNDKVICTCKFKCTVDEKDDTCAACSVDVKRCKSENVNPIYVSATNVAATESAIVAATEAAATMSALTATVMANTEATSAAATATGQATATAQVQATSVAATEVAVINATIKAVATSGAIVRALDNPRIVDDANMVSKQKVTYDCIWLGQYPQAEVIPDKSQYTAIHKRFLKDSDLIEDASLYNQLQKATYNADNTTTINGNKYIRMNRDEALCASEDVSPGGAYNQFYYWDEEDTSYHYFKFQPIKWRIIEKTTDKVFLLSDIGIDLRGYDNTHREVTWETCELRNYLNTEFYDRAFTSSEKSMISLEKIENSENLNYRTSGGNDTFDKIFILSEKDVCKDSGYGDAFENSKAVRYGFLEVAVINDNARTLRGSTYSRAMGAEWEDYYSKYLGSSGWYLRTPGRSQNMVSYVEPTGFVFDDGDGVCFSCDHECDYQSNVPYLVRPAMKVNLSTLSGAMYAGIVRTDGTVYEINPPASIIEPTPVPTSTPVVAPTVTPEPTPTVEPTVTPVPEIPPTVITSNESNNLIMDDGAKIEITGVDKSKLLVKGKSGTYDASTGTFKAIKKGTVKLYYLDGKKKVVVCTIKVEQPKLKASLKMKAGKTKKLKLSGTKRTDAVWSSSDESVASMSGGIVTAKKAGECDIIAKIGKHEWKCHVVVK